MKTIILSLLILFSSILYANNIAVTNVSISDQSALFHFCKVKFDISWDNSWRTLAVPGNWDAAWIFIKYRVAGGEWHHATLHSSGHTAPAGSVITPSADGMGVFMYRSANGNGSNSWTNTELRWNYGDDGVGDDASIELKVIAIEMVYIPQENFYIGDGNGTNESTASFHTGSTNSTVLITTSKFTKDATDFARRLQQKKLVLIDGEKLAELLMDFGVGVTRVATYTVQKMDPDYFGEE